MRILFITPCYEPGKDGVGDYTRRLGRLLDAFPEAEVEWRVIAYRDGFVADCVEDEQALRMPADWSEAERRRYGRAYVEAFAPDWISLQWVPHGYHPKGLFFAQIPTLAELSRGLRVHWMIHEIWLGAKNESTVKERLIGGWQKRLFRQLDRRLQPAIVTTQSQAYACLLQQAGYAVERLPLPSNIAVYPAAARADHKLLVAGIFSHLHPEIKVEAFMAAFTALAGQLGRVPVIRHAGKGSPVGQTIWQGWQERWGNNIRFEALGELAEAEVSRFLQGLDFCLSMTARALADKSGVNAAFRAHGVPVYCLSDHVHFPGFAADRPDDFLCGGPAEPLAEWWQSVADRPRSGPAPEVTLAQAFLKLLTDG